jgi:hypothetical protein
MCLEHPVSGDHGLRQEVTRVLLAASGTFHDGIVLQAFAGGEDRALQRMPRATVFVRAHHE